MNILPFLSSLLLSASVGMTHSCNAFVSKETVHIGDETVSKDIRLLKISTDRVQPNKFEGFFRASEKDYRSGITSFSSSGSGVDLGMAGVPVLDQGQYGTCVTFSSTAALDARLGRGDYISQQCALALDKTLGSDWWDGAYYPSQIIDPIKNYGVVEKSRCPSFYPNYDQSISAEAYQSLADKEASAEVAQINYAYTAKANINGVKTALRAGNRVLIAFLLDGSSQEAVQGFSVRVDGRSYTGGLWACKQGSSPNHCKASNAGHEVLVIGYDEKQQLLKIRNSWSSQVGDNGNYYMSYSFFNSMAVDQTVVY